MKTPYLKRILAIALAFTITVTMTPPLVAPVTPAGDRPGAAYADEQGASAGQAGATGEQGEMGATRAASAAGAAGANEASSAEQSGEGGEAADSEAAGDQSQGGQIGQGERDGQSSQGEQDGQAGADSQGEQDGQTGADGQGSQGERDGQADGQGSSSEPDSENDEGGAAASADGQSSQGEQDGQADADSQGEQDGQDGAATDSEAAGDQSQGGQSGQGDHDGQSGQNGEGGEVGQAGEDGQGGQGEQDGQDGPNGANGANEVPGADSSEAAGADSSEPPSADSSEATDTDSAESTGADSSEPPSADAEELDYDALADGEEEAAATEEDGTWDIIKLLSGSIVIENSEGVVVDDGPGPVVETGVFSYGEKYTFKISFAENTGEGMQFMNDPDGNCLRYVLPDSLTVPLAQTRDLTVTDADHGTRKVGEYTIKTDRTVEIRYTNTGDAQNPKYYFSDLKNVQLTLNVVAEFNASYVGGEIKFDDSHVITVNRVEKPKPKMTLAKTVASYDKAAETISYKVTVTAPLDNSKAEPSAVKGIVLTDIPAIGSATGFLDKDTQNIYSAVSYAINSDDADDAIPADPAWTEWVPATTGKGADGDRTRLVITFPDTVELNPGDKLTVTYTLNLKPTLENSKNTTVSTPLQYSFTTYNSVGATAKDTQTPNKATASKAVSKTFVNKDNGVWTNGSGTIKWTAWVGSGAVPLNGKQIVDDLDKTAEKLAFPAPSAIKIKFLGKPDAATGAFPTVAIATLTADNLPTYAAFSTVSGSSQKFTLTVPGAADAIPGSAESATFGDIYRVEFEYETAVPENTTAAQSSYRNDITYEGKQTDYGTVTVNNDIGPQPSVTKTSSHIVYKDIDGSGTKQYGVEYTVTVKVPKALAGKKLSYRDALWYGSADPPTDAAANKDLRVTNKPLNLTLTLDGGKTASASSAETNADLYYRYAEGTGDSANTWNLYFCDDPLALSAVSSATSKWPNLYDAGDAPGATRTLTIKYAIPLSCETVETSETPAKTVESALKNADPAVAYLVNRAYLDSDGPLHYSTTRDGWPIHKTVEAGRVETDSIISYKVTLLGAGAANLSPTARHQLFDSGETQFKDTFDAGLAYVPNSLYVIFMDGNAAADFEYYGPYDANFADQTAATRGTDATGETPGTKGSLTVDFNKMARLKTWNGDDPAKNGLYDPQNPAAGITQDWYTSPGKSGQSRQTIEIHYKLRVTNPNVEKMYSNSASVDSDILDSSYSDSASAVYRPSTDPLTKSVVTDDTNIAEFELIINPDGLDLAEDADTYKATDAMSERLVPYVQTVSAYVKTGSLGNWGAHWKTEPVEFSATAGDPWFFDYHTGKLELEGVTASDETKNIMEFVLPDETPVRITYKVYVNAETGQSVTERNDVYVFSYSDFSTLENYVVSDSSANTIGDKQPVTLRKQTKGSGELLNDAAFNLYMAIQDGKSYDGKNHEMIERGSKKFYLLESADGGSEGEYVFASDWIARSFKAIFMIEETEVPEGHYDPESPYTFFYIHQMSDGDHDALAEDLGAPVQFVPDTITIENDPIPTPAPIETPTPTETPTETPEPTPEPTETTELTPDPTPDATPEPTPPTVPEIEIILTPSPSPSPTPATVPDTTPPSYGGGQKTPSPVPPASSTPTPGGSPEASSEATPGGSPEASPEATPEDAADQPTAPPQDVDPGGGEPEDAAPGGDGDGGGDAPEPPGGDNIDIPPNPNPGGALVPDGEGGFLEFDDEGTPLGSWKWDDDAQEWVFDDGDIPQGAGEAESPAAADETPPQRGAPRTGDEPPLALLSLALAASLTGLGALGIGYLRRRMGCGRSPH